jgi:protein-S-isoprenylcysteine O-methyltransferase Ste14
MSVAILEYQKNVALVCVRTSLPTHHTRCVLKHGIFFPRSIVASIKLDEEDESEDSSKRRSRTKLDFPSLFMVLSFMANLIICFLDPLDLLRSRELGVSLFGSGCMFFLYVLFYLRSGFLGGTEPRLEYLISKGPYRFCRHPLYFSFLMIILGLDFAFGSVMGIVSTFVLSVPSVVYRARIEDNLLRSKLGEEWEDYAAKVGFLFPKVWKTNDRNRTSAR